MKVFILALISSLTISGIKAQDDLRFSFTRPYSDQQKEASVKLARERALKREAAKKKKAAVSKNESATERLSRALNNIRVFNAKTKTAIRGMSEENARAFVEDFVLALSEDRLKIFLLANSLQRLEEIESSERNQSTNIIITGLDEAIGHTFRTAIKKENNSAKELFALYSRIKTMSLLDNQENTNPTMTMTLAICTILTEMLNQENIRHDKIQEVFAALQPKQLTAVLRGKLFIYSDGKISTEKAQIGIGESQTLADVLSVVIDNRTQKDEHLLTLTRFNLELLAVADPKVQAFTDAATPLISASRSTTEELQRLRETLERAKELTTGR